MDIQISGLKCDKDGCDYRDDTIPFDEYEKSIGKPCPKCGESLLTQDDYDVTFRLLKRWSIVKKILGIFKWIDPSTYYELILGKKPSYVKYSYTKKFSKK